MAENYTTDLARELRQQLKETGKATADAIALPGDPSDGKRMGRAEFVAIVRDQSLRDPTYLATMLERLAPVALTMPNGQKLRAESGLKNFHALVKEARPDVYTAVVLTEPHPDGTYPPAVLAPHPDSQPPQEGY